MKQSLALPLAVLALLAPAASQAMKIPIPVEGATLNLSFQLQTQFQMQENGAPNGNGNSYDIFIRRSRVLINGDIGPNFTYLIQFDNPNYGKKGNFQARAYMQDAWVGWAPTGLTGPNVFFIDAGLLLLPISHNLLSSTTNYVTADNHSDAFRGLNGGALPGFRSTGVQVRGWAFNKKVGFRGGVYEGLRPAGTTPANAAIAPNANPQIAGFVNFDLIGSEEGGWLYGAYKWGKDPILSVGASGLYQSKVLVNAATSSLSDQQLISVDSYLNLPMTEAAELVAEVNLYFNRNGSNSASTGLGGSADLGYRFGAIAPYVGYDFFSADACDSGLTAKQCAPVTGTTGDARNFKLGVNYFFNKNLNHLNVEFGINHGQSKDAASNTTLTAAATKSFLMHWNTVF